MSKVFNLQGQVVATYVFDKVWNKDTSDGTPIGRFVFGRIYNKDSTDGEPIGYYGLGKIWDKGKSIHQPIGSYAIGKIFKGYPNGKLVGTYSGHDDGAAASAYLLLFK